MIENSDVPPFHVRAAFSDTRSLPLRSFEGRVANPVSEWATRPSFSPNFSVDLRVFPLPLCLTKQANDYPLFALITCLFAKQCVSMK